MKDDANGYEVLRTLLEHITKTRVFPSIEVFAKTYAIEDAQLDKLREDKLIAARDGKLYLTLDGLRACKTDDAERFLEITMEIVPGLQGNLNRLLTGAARPTRGRRKQDTVRLLDGIVGPEYRGGPRARRRAAR